MRRAALCAASLLGALALAGCGSSEESKDYGKEITSSSDVPKVDIEGEIAKIQADATMPASAKEAAIANLRRGQEMAKKQNEAKSGKN